MKCDLKCLLLGCVVQDYGCDGWSRCICNESYNLGDATLTTDDFEHLDFVELWNSFFESNEASAKVLNKIKSYDSLEAELVTLLRDPYMTGEDVISILRSEFPNWKAVDSLVTLQHGLKTEFMEAGKHIQYENLDANFEKLLELIDTVPPGDTDTSSFKIRVKNLLKKITKVEDLEDLWCLVKLSENRNLYRLVKSSLISLGYGFEEDGDDPAGKKAILQNISLDIEEADDDEKLEMVVSKKLMPQKGSAGLPKTYVRDDVDSRLQSAAAEGLVQEPGVPANVPAYGAVPYAWTGSWPPIYSGYGNGYGAYGNTGGYGEYRAPVGYEGQETDNVGGSTSYFVVYDANGNPVHVTEIPQNQVPNNPQ